MTDVTPLETEIIEASGFRMKKFSNRQLYLAALARAVEQMSADAFDTLSDEAAEWYNAACSAINQNEDISDFELDEEVDEPESDESDEADNDAESADDDDESEDSDEDEVEPDEAGETTETETPEAEEPEPEEIEEAQPEPPKKSRGRPPKAAKEPVPETEEKRPKFETDPALVAKFREQEKAKKKGKAKELPHTRYDDVTGTKNKYGYYEGTKTDDACKMFEQGAKMAEVREKLGDTYYNLLKNVQKNGHKVTKNDRGQFVLKYVEPKK